MKKTRNSSIELLKIIALIFILICHACPFYGDENLISYYDFGASFYNLQDFIMLIFRYLGNFGNIIFIICSSYFLVNNTKPINKIWQIVTDTLVISVLSLTFFSILGFDITKKDIIKQFLPITFENNWFIGCYILLYLVHPILNKAIEKMEKSELLKVCLFLIIVYSFIQFVLPHVYYYNSLIAFISIYFITAYLKLYLRNFSNNKKINLILIIISMSSFIVFLGLYNFISSKFSIFCNNMRWSNLMNPFLLVFCFSMFSLFNSYNYKNKVINYVSSYSLLLYIIHENYIFRTYVKPLFYQKVFLINDYKIMWILFEAVLLFIYGIIMAILYRKTIQRGTRKIANLLDVFLTKVINKVTNIIMKID